MISYDEVVETIKEIENSEITLKSCNDLANLYIIKEHIEKQDMLPDSNVDETVDEIQTLAIRYVTHRDLIDLNMMLNLFSKLISELYNTCEDEKEKSEFYVFFDDLKTIIH